MELAGKVAAVTGGGSGIGRALCERFAAEGAKVVVADIDGGSARRVAKEVGGLAVTTDVASDPQMAALVARILGEHGRLDVFCSNAGIALGSGPETPTEEWQRIWEVNVLAHVFAARHALPPLLARGEGYFLGTISAAGLLNHVLCAPYGVTKAAALSFLEWMAIAHGDQGLRVSCLCPQGVRTRMLAADPSGFLNAGSLAPEEVAEVVVQGMREERFLILPHPEVAEYFRRKAGDYDRWLRGMRRLRQRVLNA